MKRILVSVIFTLLLLPCAYSQENITDCDELAIITSALKGSRGVEYIRRDHRPVNGKTFRGTNPINITTYLFKRNDRGKNEYEHLAADSKYMDRDMYNDFLEKNKESVIVDTTRFDDCILDFTTLEQARQFLDPALDDEAQSKKLLEL
ncbi:MAG: hypothetical protein LBV43_06860, partial [Prevotella sp.]|nr:hypothetical protein [Prevotella sp.]